MGRTAFIALVLLMASAAPAMASPTDAFEAQFRQHFGRGVELPAGRAPSTSAVPVGSPATAPAELTLVATSTAATSITGCGFALVVTGTATIQLEDGSSLVLDEAGTYCLPGGSTFAPGNFFHSYGNPWKIDATYDVVGGTGVFAGATGSGTNTIRVRGTRRWPCTQGRSRCRDGVTVSSRLRMRSPLVERAISGLWSLRTMRQAHSAAVGTLMLTSHRGTVDDETLVAGDVGWTPSRRAGIRQETSYGT